MLETLSGAFDLALAIIGFGAIIFIHELGHFLAAKWAGVRVLQFAIGFGTPIVSWRKGIGFRAPVEDILIAGSGGGNTTA